VLGSITLFVDGGTLKMVLNDKDNNRSAFVECSSFAGLWDLAEMKMSKNELEWKPNRWSNGGSSKVPF